MKNVLSRSISLLLAVMLVCALSVSASASDMSTYASDYLSKYDGAVTAQGNGVIKISFVVIGTEVIDEIGASKIVVEEKSGSAWIPVKTYNNTRNPELSSL